MRRVLAVLLLLALAACSDDSAEVATDPGSSRPPEPVPAGPVRTAQLATVMDEGDGVELCLGAVAESYPPQCGGPPVTGWDWSAMGQGMHEQQGSVTWGSYAVTGTWDGATFAATEALPAALYDPVMVPPLEPAGTTYSEARLEEIAAELSEVAVGATPVDGRVLAEVYYDDGSLQAWADDTYGAGAVAVTPYLVDAG
jgi:hypothetical protein